VLNHRALAIAGLICISASTSRAQDEPDAPSPSEKSGFSYSLFGYLRLRGAFIEDDPNVAFVGRNDGFALQNARIGLNGSWGPLTARVSVDGAVDERQGANATSGTLRVALEDAFADIKIAEALSIRVVRFEILFDLEDYIPYSRRVFTDFALESRGVLPTQGFEAAGLSPGRSLGVALRSDHALTLGPLALGYELAAQNGNGAYASANDNDSFAFSAALFGHIGDSFVFVAGRQKTRTTGTLPLLQTQEELHGAAGGVIRVGPVELAGQVLARRTSFPTTGGPVEDSIGGHAQLAVSVPLGDEATLQAGYRFAIYDPSDLVDNDQVIEHTVGLVLSLERLPIRLQVDATHAVEQAGRELANDRLQAVFEVSL